MEYEQKKLTMRIYYAQIILDDLKKVVKKAEKEINRLRLLRYKQYGGAIPYFLKDKVEGKS